MDWHDVTEAPTENGPYLVLMPSRDIDQFSVQYFHHIDGWSSNYGITRWAHLEPPNAGKR